MLCGYLPRPSLFSVPWGKRMCRSLHYVTYVCDIWALSWMHHAPGPRPLSCSWNSLITYLTLWLFSLALDSCLDCSLSLLLLNGWTALSPPFEWLTLFLQIQLKCYFEGVTFLDLSFHQSSSSSSGSFCISYLPSVHGDTLTANESHSCSLSLCWKAAHPELSF